jgi:ABC-type glycerol-3-phosphate transport system permease component
MTLKRYTAPILNVISQYIVMVFFAFLFLYPILWLLINSFKNSQELFQSPWSLPKNLTIDNYVRAVVEGPSDAIL